MRKSTTSENHVIVWTYRYVILVLVFEKKNLKTVVIATFPYFQTCTLLDTPPVLLCVIVENIPYCLKIDSTSGKGKCYDLEKI